MAAFNDYSYVYVIDKTIWDLYQHTLSVHINQDVVYLVRAGESLKTWRGLQRLIHWLTEKNVGRHARLLAIGGGTIGDLVGFAAGIFKRGITWDFMPTTLIAHADSSIGGKTGINTRQSKNQIGIFNPPHHTFIDINFLKTLPQRQLCAGYAEILKVALIADADFFAYLENEGKQIFEKKQILSYIVKKSIHLKLRIIGDDWLDSGESTRQLLNLGHTFGHAYEFIRGPRLLHGEAVALGMLTATKVAQRCGYVSPLLYTRLQQLWGEVNLPKDDGVILKKKGNIEKIATFLRHDKKWNNGFLSVILPHDVGDVRVKKMALSDVLSAIA